ncbi:hypothetical protein UlMin_006528 [Ulmus minor]
MEIVYGTATKVLELLASKAYQEISLAWGVRDELRKLQQTVSIIQAVLLDAEEKQAHNRQISVWLAELKDVLLDAEELLGEFECEDLRKKVVKLRGSNRKKVCYFFSRSNPLVFCFSLGRKIKDMRNKLDGIAAKKKEFGLEEGHERKQIISEGRVTHSYVCASDVIGREDDRKNIIHRLMEPCDQSNVSVIPIRGIGGLGKTTLAKLVYNDERVQSHFGLKMWVCVSENFDVPRLIKEILDSATGKVSEELNLDQLQKGLRDKLEAQRFLLILDDVWSDSREKWFALKELLIVGSVGSKIIVTTRKQSVADLMGTFSTYNLKGLPSKDCLSLFIKWAFKDGEAKQHPNLVKIGAEIVEKCKGLPLAVTTLGSLLYSKLDEGDWKYIRDNEIWKLEQKEDHVLPALQLSYNELPSYLKRCFHYCSLFPKDYRFNSWDLIQLWMAHGLLVQTDGHRNKSLQEIGELYFKQLWSRSFFQHVVEHPNGGEYTFQMHDLIHDLAQLMSKNECSIITSPTDIVLERVRHLSITCSCDEELACFDKLKSVHTIIVSAESHLSSPPSTSFNEKYFLKFKFLRVLGLSNSSFEVLPSDIGRMKHLRYLDLSYNEEIRELPSSICKLQSLQSLLLGGCTNLKGLPSDINCLISLSLLIITTTATSLPEMEGLTSLNDLSLWSCPNLISLPKSVRCLTALQTLVISDCRMLTLREDKDNDQVSKFSLRRLTIQHLPKLVALPQWLRGCEGTLQFFAVEGCPSFKELPQWLPKTDSLQNLQIRFCPELQSLPAEEMHLLSSLRKLTIAGCPKLRNSLKEIRKEWLQNINFLCYACSEEDEVRTIKSQTFSLKLLFNINLIFFFIMIRKWMTLKLKEMK